MIICNAAVSACEKGQQQSSGRGLGVGMLVLSGIQRSFKDELLSWLPTQRLPCHSFASVLVYIFWY